MKTLRSMTQLRWWVAAWFLLSLGVAVASPIVQPRTMDLVCSGSGAAKIVIQSTNGAAASDVQDMDCPLCLLESIPPEPLNTGLPASLAIAVAPRQRACDPLPASTAAPPPARAPPVSKCLNQERSS
jgi:hypothetical protein